MNSQFLHSLKSPCETQLTFYLKNTQARSPFYASVRKWLIRTVGSQVCIQQFLVHIKFRYFLQSFLIILLILFPFCFPLIKIHEAVLSRTFWLSYQWPSLLHFVPLLLGVLFKGVFLLRFWWIPLVFSFRQLFFYAIY